MESRPQQVMDALRRIVQAIRLSSAQSERASGLTAAQVLVLRHVHASAGLSINDLAAVTLTHQSTVSEVVGRLEAKGLLVRGRSAEDGRRREVQLTDKGAALLKATGRTFQETLMEALDGLPPKSLEGLADGLGALIDAAGLGAAAAPMFLEDDGN
ncbi:MAG TPA: MarR family transcriptional regulator [Asticcacaulis sp.]|nr:MarR family transcriptional regulator [Asticcacaulis sp.]